MKGFKLEETAIQHLAQPVGKLMKYLAGSTPDSTGQAPAWQGQLTADVLWPTLRPGVLHMCHLAWLLHTQ